MGDFNREEASRRIAGFEDAGLHSLARPGTILERTVRGAGWVIGWRMVTRGLGMVSTLFLVRLLTPADFGAVALVMTIAQGLDQISSVGVEQAIIRADKPTRKLYDTAFTINVIRGLVMASLLAISAGPIAHFFGDQRLVKLVYVAALGSAVGAFENIGIVDFRRFIAFDKEFMLKVVPRIVSVFAAIGLAMWLRSYWALICAILISQILTIVMGYILHPMRPRFCLTEWHEISGYSFWSWLISLIGVLRASSDNFVLGHIFGPAQVGIYGVGAEIAALPNSELVAPLCRAAFGGFAVARREGDNGAQTFLSLLGLMAVLTVPVGCGLSLVAAPLVRLAFGTKWLAAVPLVQLLGVAGILTLFGSVSATLFAANAWLRTMMRVNIVIAALRVALLVAFVPRMGVLGAGIAVAITDIADQLIYLTMTVRKLQISIGAIVRRVARTLFAAGVMALVVILSGLGRGGWPTSSGALSVRLGEIVLLGAAVYVTALLATWVSCGRPEGAETEVIRLFRGVFRRDAVKSC